MANKLKAIHRGNFHENFGIDVDCYVINDKRKTAVISQRGMGAAIGLGEGGSRLPTFVRGKGISRYIGPELREKLDNPIVFQSFNMGTELDKSPGTTTYGYDVTVLIDVCKAIIDMKNDGNLLKSQHGIAKQAHTIINASAKLGIQQLVYALSGYEAERQEIIDQFRVFVQDEAREYEREFPEPLYQEWYRIYDLPRPTRNRPWKFMHLTREHVYYPLAKSKGKLQELITSQREAASQEKKKRLHQFLSQVGVKALRQHLGQLLGIAQLSDTKEEYENNVKKVFGETKPNAERKDEAAFDMVAIDEEQKNPPSEHNQALKKAIAYNPKAKPK
jgi:hypothetical protein